MYQTISKTIVAWLFNKYIAYYFFDNININQLKLAFNEGQLELKDLPIKSDALRHLCIPLNVISGNVGKLVIQIPLLSLLTTPWDIAISDLTLVVSPPRSQLKMIKESSQPSIPDYLDESMLDGELICNSEETKLAEFYNSFSSAVSSMARDVFRNLRLKINSIKIVFEGNKTRIEADKLSLTRPDSEKRLVITNLSISGPHPDGLSIDRCDLKIRDVAHNSYEFISDHDIAGELFIEGAKPQAKFLLEDFRLLFYTSDQQQDGSIFARISCSHFNRDKLSWENFLDPWPFNLSWDKLKDLRRLKLTSDEVAGFSINSALLDLIELIIKRITSDTSKSWPLVIKSKQRDCFAKHDSPQDFKITYYNYNTNLAQQIGARSARQLFIHPVRNNSFDVSFVGPGIRATLLDNNDERFLMITMENIIIESTTKSKEQVIDCSILNLRIENMMPDCEKTIVLDRASSNKGRHKPAFTLIIDRILGRSFGTVWFKQVQMSMCELFLNIEEELFLKCVEFVSFRLRKPKRNVHRDLDRLIHPEQRQSKYYFDLLRIDLSSLELSVFLAKSLPETLQRLKTLSGLKFFGFEDARVELAPYFKMNITRTFGGILESVTKFYKRQMSEQAPRIVVQQIQNYMLFHWSDILSSLYDEVYNQLF